MEPTSEKSAPSTTGGLMLRADLASARAWLQTDGSGFLLLVLILLVGAYLRLSHVDWDQGTHIHPDERFLTMVEDALQIPQSLGQFFDSTVSPMNPYNKGYGFFVYGTLPIFIVRVVAELAHEFNQVAKVWTSAPDVPVALIGYGGVHFVGRTLSGLFDLAGVALIFVIGRRLYGRWVGLLAAAFLAFAVLPLQQSHFFTVDTFGTFFSLLTFYFAVRVALGGRGSRPSGGWGTYLALGASLGASIACRINLAPLAGIALLAAGVRAWDDWHRLENRNGAWVSTLLQATLFRLLLMSIVALVVFRIAQPYAFGGRSLLDLTFSDRWRENMHEVSELIRGERDYPPGHQWANRTPFVFPFVNMVVWGMGLPLGLAAWAGWAVAAWQIIRGLTTRPDPTAVRVHLLPVAWIGGMFLWQGLQYVQSMRYLLPLYPILCMMAAWLLWGLVVRARSRKEEAGSRRLALPAAYALLVLVLVATMLWGWGFLAIYRRPLTRLTASEWIYDNIPTGSVIANEHWDDPLPMRTPDKDPFGGFGYRGLLSSSDGLMQMYGEDTPEKREQLYRWLDEADYIVLSSNRLWGSIPRLPMRYPMTSLYYRLLFSGKLGFEQVLRVTSFPTILGLKFDDSQAEEAFSVYDHPEVRIFRKTPAYSEALARSYFDPVDLENTIQMWPKQVSAAPTALLFDGAEAALQQAGGTWSRLFKLDSLVNRSQVLSVVAWLALLELLGVVAFPLAYVVLRSLSDRGYGVSKVLGILLLTWLSWIGPSLHAVPYQRWWIFLCLGILIFASGAVAWRHRRAIGAFWRERRDLLITEEVLFLLLFALLLLIRWGNPDLWHPARGGEKPMDFAYLNAVIKSTHFPPYDPWQAGGFLNYYYFGFVVIAAVTMLTGIVPWVAYNLAVPTLFAMTGLGAFCVAYNLADGDAAARFPGDAGTDQSGPFQSRPGLPVGSVLAGLSAAFFVVIVGNLGNAKLLIDQLSLRGQGAVQSTIPGLAKLIGAISGLGAVLSSKASLDFPNDWWFWNASRAIPDTINEFPFFTFIYADLHAHMIALPFTLFGLAIAVALARLGDSTAPTAGREPSPWRISLPELQLIVLAGFVVGSLRATNTWDFPTYILVGLIAIGVLEATRRLALPPPTERSDRLAFLFRGAVAVMWRTLILVLTASLLFYPYTMHYATAYAGVQRYKETTTALPDYLTVWGLFLALVVIYLVSELIQQSREHRVAKWVRALRPAIIVAVVLLVGIGWVVNASVWLVALPLAVLAVVLAAGRDLPPSRRLVLLLIGLALAITMGVEVVRLKDDIGRMNTVFKFYLQAWVLLAIAGAVGLASWIPRSFGWRAGWRRLAWAVPAVLFVAAMLYPPFAARAKVADRFSPDASPRTLDGMAYMDGAQYFDKDRDMRLGDDKAAIRWMLQNVSGSPVILEGVTPGYRWGNRFSVYTGLPAVQGWDWHQKQQRSVVPSIVIDRRLAHVAEIYNTTDLARARRLLDYYGVEYIVVGELERAYYAPEGLAKLDTLADQGYLQLVYPGVEARGSGIDGVRIYRVVGRGKEMPAQAESHVGPQPIPTPTAAPDAEAQQPELPSSAPFDSPLQ